MDTNELLKKVRNIEIKTKGLSNHIFSGKYQTAFKGRGMDFSEVREYHSGDDIRSIDWNVTARYNHPFSKVFDEEREMTIILLIDVSGSSDFGTNTQLKKDLSTEISAILSFSAIKNNDKIGVIFFTDKIEKYIPAKKGRSHTLRIIRELITLKPSSKKTNIGSAIKYFNNVIKRRSICFVLSDFINDDFSKSLVIANRKHDIICIHIYDRLETNFPNIGLIKLYDPESGKNILFDTSDKHKRLNFKKRHQEFTNKTINILRKIGVQYISLETGKDYVKPLINFFKNRD